MQRIYIDLNSEGLKLQSITKTNNIIILHNNNTSFKGQKD